MKELLEALWRQYEEALAKLIDLNLQVEGWGTGGGAWEEARLRREVERWGGCGGRWKRGGRGGGGGGGGGKTDDAPRPPQARKETMRKEEKRAQHVALCWGLKGREAMGKLVGEKCRIVR